VATATDAVGHKTDSQTDVVSLDTLPPALTIDTADLPAITSTAKVTVTGTVSDPHLTLVKVNGVVAKVTGTDFTAADVPLAEGDNTLTTYAEDTVGLSGEIHHSTTRTAAVALDTIAPVLTITDPAPGARIATSRYTVKGTIGDPHPSKVLVGTVVATLT